MGRFWIKTKRTRATRPGTSRRPPKRMRQSHRALTVGDMEVVQTRAPHHSDDGTEALGASLIDLPPELIEAIALLLTGHDLAALACTCRALESIAGADRMWRKAFERDLGVSYPPYEHVDHTHYGKSVRWLYGLVKTPVGRLRSTPSGALAGRIVAADGVTKRSGEFSIDVDDAGKAVVRLHGYGATVQGTENKEDATTEWSLREGIYDRDRIIGRMRHLAGGISKDGAEPTDHDYCFRGDSLDGEDYGFGVTVNSDGHAHYGEHDAMHYNGRCLVLSGINDVYSGQLVNDVYLGYGVTLAHKASAITCEALRTSEGFAWAIMRSTDSCHAWSAARACRFTGARGQLVPESLQIVYKKPTTHASYIYGSDGNAIERFDHRGHTLVLHDGAPVFLAISDTHPTLAGLRLFYKDDDQPVSDDGTNGNAAIVDKGGANYVDNNGDENGKVGGDNKAKTDRHTRHQQRPLICNVARPSKRLRRDYDVEVVSGPRMPSLDRTTAIAYLDSLSDGDAVGLLGRMLKYTEPTADLALYSPFGVPLHDDGGGCGTVSVRCFVTGLRTEAFRCIFAPNGRLYSIDGLREWKRMCIYASTPFTDPCTGDIIPPNMPQFVWQGWMERVPLALLESAVRAAFSRWASLPECSLPKTGSYASECRLVDDLVRKRIFDALGLPLFDAAQVLHAKDAALTGCRTAPPATEALINAVSSSPQPPTMGWDHTRIAHVEFRHPSWDPRGRWRFGPPPPNIMPDDPTLADYERDPDAAPADYYASHGVVKIALSRPSFVGAHLRDVFFVGQDLSGASFVGATLDRCAFVGCMLDDWMLLDASLIMCGVHDCHIGDDVYNNVADATCNRGALVWP